MSVVTTPAAKEGQPFNGLIRREQPPCARLDLNPGLHRSPSRQVARGVVLQTDHDAVLRLLNRLHLLRQRFVRHRDEGAIADIYRRDVARADGDPDREPILAANHKNR
jgi:hypothetical protein